MHGLEAMRFGTFPFGELSATVWLLILLALVFDFLNGFHDAANSVATVVSTRVLSPYVAVLWAAFFNFVAFLVFPLGVANTIAKTLVFEQIQDAVNEVIMATLVAACAWNVLTWYLALPTSSSHALMGGLIGAGLAKTWSAGVLHWPNVLTTVLFIFVSPALGLTCGLLLSLLIHWVCRPPSPKRADVLSPLLGLAAGALAAVGGYDLTAAAQAALAEYGGLALPGEGWAYAGGAVAGLAVGVALWAVVRWMRQAPSPRRVDRVFRWGQLFSAAWFSLTHGGNDAQKTMGVIFVLLAAAQAAKGGGTAIPQPFEVVLACHFAIGLGTMFGGWRIVKTMGQRITRLRPVDGFCAENGAGLAVALATSVFHAPVSTTHTITGAILGVGTLKRFSAVRWGVARQVVWAWILTIPGSALVAALTWWALQGLRWLGGLVFHG
jgi:inorganic phosphate transporter, PiT family